MENTKTQSPVTCDRSRTRPCAVDPIKYGLSRSNVSYAPVCPRQPSSVAGYSAMIRHVVTVDNAHCVVRWQALSSSNVYVYTLNTSNPPYNNLQVLFGLCLLATHHF